MSVVAVIPLSSTSCLLTLSFSFSLSLCFTSGRAEEERVQRSLLTGSRGLFEKFMILPPQGYFSLSSFVARVLREREREKRKPWTEKVLFPFMFFSSSEDVVNLFSVKK